MAEEIKKLSTTFSCNDQMSKALSRISGNVLGLMGDFEKLQGEMLELSTVDPLKNTPKSFGLAQKMQTGLIASSGLLADKIGIGATAQNLFTKAVVGSNTAMKGLMLTVAPLALVAGALFGALGSMDKVDAYTGLQSRLRLITGDLSKVDDLNTKIFNSAQRARGSYTEMADNVSKLGLLAGHAFANTGEMVTFVEQLSKQFKIAGTGAGEASSAMYQLTQAMASGRLQGDEFRSIMENAPMLAQSIAKEMGVPIAKMRELSSAGLITSDVIKRALTNPQAMQEVNKQFSSIPLKFSEMVAGLGNIAQTSFSEVFAKIGGALNSDGFKRMYEIIGGGIVVVAEFASIAFNGFSLIGQALSWTVGVFESFNSVILGVASCYPLIIGGASAYAGWLAVVNAETIVGNMATLAGNAGLFAKNALLIGTNALMRLYGANLSLVGIKAGFATAKQWLLNVAMSMNPMGLLVGATVGLVGALSALALRTTSLREIMAGAWTGIAKVAGGTINFMIDRLNELIKVINAGGDMFGGIFGFDYKEIKTVGKIDTDGVAKWGADIAKNFKFSDITDKFAISPQGFGGMGGLETSAQTIAENTGSIKEALENNFETVDELRQLAMSDGVSNLTKQDIKIEVINNNTVNSDLDIDGIGDNIAQSLFRAVQVNRNGV